MISVKYKRAIIKQCTWLPLTNNLTVNFVFATAFLRLISLLSVTSPCPFSLTLDDDPGIFSLDVVDFLYNFSVTNSISIVCI